MAWRTDEENARRRATQSGKRGAAAFRGTGRKAVTQAARTSDISKGFKGSGAVAAGRKAVDIIGRISGKKVPSRIAAMIAKFFGAGISGPLSVFMGLWLMKDIAEMAGVGPRSRELAAGKEARQQDLLANAMLISDERGERQQARMDATLDRTQTQIGAQADREGLRELAALNMAQGGIQRTSDLGSSLGQALSMASINRALQPQEDPDRPSQLLGF